MTPMHDYVLAFDVGGTYIKAGVVRGDGTVIGPVSEYPAKSGEKKEALLEHFAAIIKAEGRRVPAGHSIRGAGLAFPGPFDYERGICLIRGLNKFEALYGVNLKEQLTARVALLPELQGRWSHSPVIAFENDAGLFALGECAFGAGRSTMRAICLTIGTGFGSAFVSNGRLVKEGDDVPADGWLYRIPYRDGMMDDYFSRRGIVRLAEEMGIEDAASGEDDVKRLAERAWAGEPLPVRLFREFGERLAEVLTPFTRSFGPDAIIIGGQIAKSADLFISGPIDGVPVRIASDMSASALKGAYQLFQPS